VSSGLENSIKISARKRIKKGGEEDRLNGTRYTYPFVFIYLRVSVELTSQKEYRRDELVRTLKKVFGAGIFDYHDERSFSEKENYPIHRIHRKKIGMSFISLSRRN